MQNSIWYFSLCSHGDGRALTNSQRASCGASERDLTLGLTNNHAGGNSSTHMPSGSDDLQQDTQWINLKLSDVCILKSTKLALFTQTGAISGTTAVNRWDVCYARTSRSGLCNRPRTSSGSSASVWMNPLVKAQTRRFTGRGGSCRVQWRLCVRAGKHGLDQRWTVRHSAVTMCRK